MTKLKRKIVSLWSGFRSSGHVTGEPKSLEKVSRGTEVIQIQSMDNRRGLGDRQIPQVPPRKVKVDKRDNLITKVIESTNNKWLTVMTKGLKGDRDDLARLDEIGQLLILDLERTQNLSHEDIFKGEQGHFYFDRTYRIYDQSYRVLLEPVVTKVCEELSLFNGDPTKSGQDDKESLAIVLLRLYMTVREFCRFALSLDSVTNLHVCGAYQKWFHLAIPIWIDLQFQRSRNCIERAINIDEILKPLQDLTGEYKYLKWSSSADDTALEFYKIVNSLRNLSCSDFLNGELQADLIDQTIEAIFQCVRFYAKMTSWKVEEALEIKKRTGGPKIYKISTWLCRLVNNLRYLTIEVQKSCSTLENLETRHKDKIQQIKKFIDEQIDDILRPAVAKMQPVISHYLKVDVEGVEGQRLKSVDYIHQNLHRFKEQLPPEDYESMNYQVMVMTSRTVRQMILSSLATSDKKSSIKGKKILEYSQRINCVMSQLVKLFNSTTSTAPNPMAPATLRRSSILVGRLTDLRGLSTAHLIFKLLQEIQESQNESQYKGYGQRQVNALATNVGLLKVHLTYSRDSRILLIENVSCQRLRNCDGRNSTPSPYLKVELVPRDLYPQSKKMKSRYRSRTRNPVFDESFSMLLSPEEIEEGGLIRIWIKNHVWFKKNVLIGEAFIPLESVQGHGDVHGDETLVQSRELTLPSRSDPYKNILRELEKISNL